MIEEKVFKGEWMLPGSSESFSGTLTFDTMNGLLLEMIGNYHSGFSGRYHEVIHGDTDKGFVTLLYVRHKQGFSSNVTSIQTKISNANFLLSGYKFKKVDDCVFTKVEFTLFNLLEWVNHNALEHIERKDGHQFDYKRPDKVIFQCYPGFEGEIYFGLEGEYRNGRYQLDLEQFCKVIFTYKEPTPLQTILKDIYKYLGFLTLCTYEQSYPMTITLFDEHIKDEFATKAMREDITQPVECIFRHPAYKPSYKKRELHQHLVRYDGIIATFSDNISKWFRDNDELGSILELLLRGFKDKYNFTAENFMDVVRAIESFDRINSKIHVISKAEVEEIRKVINDSSLSEKQKELANEKLNYSYEPSLRRRLENMIDLYSSTYFNERVPDKSSWLKRVRDLRNHYTHLDKRQKKHEHDVKELFNLTEDLKLLLFAAVFKSIGIAEDAYADSIRQLIY